METPPVHAVIVGRLTEIHPDYVLIGGGEGTRIPLPPGFSVQHLQEGVGVTIITTRRDGHVVVERIWKSPVTGYGA